MRDFRLPGDEVLFRFFNASRIEALDAAFRVASQPLFGFAVAGALGLWLASSYRVRAIRPLAQAILSAGAADLIGFRILKPLIARTRPNYALGSEGARVLSEAANVGSMPSLHAATTFAVATTLILLSPQIGRVALPIAFFIAVSRIGVGVHWPSDVLVGALYGAALAFGVEALARKAFGAFDHRIRSGADEAFDRGKARIDAARAEKSGAGKR